MKKTIFFLLISLLFIGQIKASVGDSIDVVHYKIELQNIDLVSKIITAKTTLNLKSKVDLSAFDLELKNLTVSQIESDDVTIAGFSQQNEKINIQLASVLTADQEIEIAIFYSGIPFHEDWGGFHYNGNYAFNLGVGFDSDPHNLGKAWFPCVDNFVDKATYELFITVPEETEAVCGGVLNDVISNGNGTYTWHWIISQEISTYLVSVAIGDYALYEDVFPGMERDIPITAYVKPASLNNVAGTLEHIHEIMNHFESHYGPYPFNRVGYVGTSIGAMEHIDNIAFPHSCFTGDLTYEDLVAHELSHMWFGNKVTCANAGDMWLNEGWATFCANYYMTDIYDRETYQAAMTQLTYTVLKNAHITDNSYLSLHDVPTEYTYGATVYDKGATVVHTLMNYLGEDVFFEAIRAYLNEYAYNSATSENMRDFLSEYTGVDLTDFFETWVFTPGTPHYSIDSVKIEPSGTDYNVHLFMRQKHKGCNHIGNSCIVEVAFMDENWQVQTDTVHFDGETGYSIKTIDFESVMVIVDYYDKTADARSEKNLVVKETGETTISIASFKLRVNEIFDSTFVRVTHHWAAPDSLKTPVEGLRISPYRYWSVDYVSAQEPQMSGGFYYQKGNAYDANLIFSQNDSVTVLYRPDAAHDWQSISTFREGIWTIGYVFATELRPGDYTLAVWDKTIIGQNESTIQKPDEMKIFPNPTKNHTKVSWENPESGEIIIKDVFGKEVKKVNYRNSNCVSISTSRLRQGIYLVERFSETGKSAGVKKMIIQ